MNSKTKCLSRWFRELNWVCRRGGVWYTQCEHRSCPACGRGWVFLDNSWRPL